MSPMNFRDHLDVKPPSVTSSNVQCHNKTLSGIRRLNPSYDKVAGVFTNFSSKE